MSSIKHTGPTPDFERAWSSDDSPSTCATYAFGSLTLKSWAPRQAVSAHVGTVTAWDVTFVDHEESFISLDLSRNGDEVGGYLDLADAIEMRDALTEAITKAAENA